MRVRDLRHILLLQGRAERGNCLDAVFPECGNDGPWSARKDAARPVVHGGSRDRRFNPSMPVGYHRRSVQARERGVRFQGTAIAARSSSRTVECASLASKSLAASAPACRCMRAGCVSSWTSLSLRMETWV